MNKVVVLSSIFVFCDGFISGTHFSKRSANWLTHEYLLIPWCVNVSFVEREECFYLWAALKIRCSKFGAIILGANECTHVEI